MQKHKMKAQGFAWKPLSGSRPCVTLYWNDVYERYIDWQDEADNKDEIYEELNMILTKEGTRTKREEKGKEKKDWIKENV